MIRARWLQADWGLTLRQLASALKEKQYAGNNLEGLVIDRIRRDSIEARYIQRLELTEVVKDPFGNESSFQRISFNEQVFVISTGNPGLELKNGLRSLNSFFSLLSQVTDFKFTVKSIGVDVDAWLAVLVRETTIKLIPDAVQVGSIVFRDGSVARAIVKSGRGDARTAANEIVSGKSYVVEKVRLRAESGKRGSVLLASNCSVAISGFSVHEESLFLDELRGALRKIIE